MPHLLNHSGPAYKHFEIAKGTLFNSETKESVEINGITLTGQLVNIDASNNFNISLVDHVWLIMKSIFNERTFSFSKSGVIKENKK